MEIGKERKSLMRKADKEQQEMKMGLAVAVKMLQSMTQLCQHFINYKYEKGSKNDISKS